MWESDKEPDSTKKNWNELKEEERIAAEMLGYNKKKVSDGGSTGLEIIHCRLS